MTTLDELFYLLFKSDRELSSPTWQNRTHQAIIFKFEAAKIPFNFGKTDDNRSVTDLPDTVTIIM